MNLEPDDNRLQQLLEENEQLRKQLQSSTRTMRRWRRVKKTVGNKVGRVFVGRGLVQSFNKLYDELPDRVSKETFAELSAHIIWRITRIGMFAIMIGLIPLLVLVVQTIILRQQNKLSAQQNELFELQIKQLNKQNELISGQNNLFQEQNLLFSNQNQNVEKQNTLVEGQNQLVDNQNSLVSLQNNLFDNQNQLVGQQNKRIEQQTELIEADRRSSLVFLMSNIMDKVDEEIKSAGANDRVLSFEVIGRISALSQSLKPYRYLQNDQLIERPLSPERGQLLLSLVNTQLDRNKTIPTLYKNANFNFADLSEAYLEDAFLAGAKINYASLHFAKASNANLMGAKLAEADLREAHLQNCNLAEADLRHARFQTAELANSDFTGATAIYAQFDGADLTGANFLGAYLHNASFKDTDLTEVNFSGATLQGADLTGAVINDIKVDSENWFNQLRRWNVIGLLDIEKQYILEEDAEGEWIVKER